MRISASHWPILDDKLFEWQHQHHDACFLITGPLFWLEAIKYWRKIPDYAKLPMPQSSDSWLTRFKQRHFLRYYIFLGKSVLVPSSIYDEIKPIQAVCDQY